MKALEEVQGLNPSSARFGGMEEIRRAILAMAQEYGARLNTLETWSSGQTVEEPLKPRPVLGNCAHAAHSGASHSMRTDCIGWHGRVLVGPASGPVALVPGELRHVPEQSPGLHYEELRSKVERLQAEETQLRERALKAESELSRARDTWEQQRREGKAENERLIGQLNEAQAEARKLGGEVDRLNRALEANRRAYEERQRSLELANDEANRLSEKVEKAREALK